MRTRSMWPWIASKLRHSKPWLRSAVFCFIAVSLAAAQVAVDAQADGATRAGVAASAAAAATTAPSVAAGARMNAELKSTIDAGKARVGDAVVAQTTSNVKSGGRVVLPKGSRLLGRITQVSASNRGRTPSSVGVVFDTAVTRRSERIPLNAGISGVVNMAAEMNVDEMGPPQMGAMDGPEMGGPGTGAAGTMGGARGSVGGAVGATTTAGEIGMAGAGVGVPGMAGGGPVRGSNGVPIAIRFPDVVATASGSVVQGSLLTAQRGNVKLDSGTHIEVQILASSGAESGALHR